MTTYKLAKMARECAQDLGFSNNQFVAVLHKDTVHPHIQIVACKALAASGKFMVLHLKHYYK